MYSPDIGDALPKRGNRLSQLIAHYLLSLFGWHIEAAVPNLPKFVLVGAPHTSNLDFFLTLATFYSLRVKISWMGKPSLFRPPIGGILKWLGGVPIARGSKSEGIVEQTVAAFDSRDKFIMAIMPEGTRSKVRQWKTGFYHIAQGAKVPIVLVRFDYGRKVMGVGPTIEPTGNLPADLDQIRAVYANIKGRHPSRS